MSIKRNNEFASIKEVMQDVLKENKLQKGIDILKVENAWGEVMGSGVLSYTEDIIFKNNILIVKLSSSVLREELSHGKEKIVDMLNKKLKKVLIKNMKLI